MSVILEVNYLAVLVCGVISMGIGTLWYSPILLGKIWADAVDKSEEEFKKELRPLQTFGLTFIGQLFIAYSLAQLMVHTNASTVPEGIRLAFLCWFGFIAAPMLINTLFEGRSKKLLLVDSGYHLINLLIFGIVLGAWSI
jgi:hypothetical protein